MAERVTIDVDRGVADVRLNRPDKLNALDGAMFAAIAEAIEAIEADPAIRVAVVSGEGRGFCAGLDIAAFLGASAGAAGATGAAGAAGNPAGDGSDAATAGAGSGARSDLRDLGDRLPGRATNLAQQVAWGWHTLPQPVIAAVHGPCFGGGLQIALGADLRVVAPDARLSVMEIRWGLLPDMAGPQLLPRLVGLDVAKELCFTGREVSGAEAARLGLATRVADDPRGEALALAATIAGRNPEAVRGMKALLNATGTRPAADGLLEESRRMAALIGSPNQLEAVSAELERRAPLFTDPVG